MIPFAEINAEGWVAIITTFGSLILLPLVGMYFKFRLDAIQATQASQIEKSTARTETILDIQQKVQTLTEKSS